MFPLALLLAIIFHWLWLVYDLLITRIQERGNEAGKIHFREKKLILGYFAKTNTYKMRRSTSVEYCDLPVITDQLTEGNVRVFLFNFLHPTIDIDLTLTTDLLETKERSPSSDLPFGFPGCRVDLSAAIEAARVFDTLIAAVRAACRRYQKDLMTGKEIVVYQPRYFHGLNFDLTAAIEIARMQQSPSVVLTFIDYRRLTKLSIPAEFFAGFGDLAQIIADETFVVDGDRQNCGSTIVVNERQQHPLTVTGVETPRACRDVQKENQVSLAFVYDDDFAQQLPDEPVSALVKWDGPSDVTDHNLDLGRSEGWEVSEMFAINKADFGYKTTFDEAMSEYTTVLVKDNTPEFRRRWERACRLADEIEATKKQGRDKSAKLPKQRKRKNRNTKKIALHYHYY